ncbi:hypothetical protein Sjap_004289 [Stephania japonica]|uniref:Rad50/SbcC-type AAA domain-containing protein n=1 Tax=Stephania japonica TaxID=461633 RepID=A0AAP0PKS8_9MAGN
MADARAYAAAVESLSSLPPRPLAGVISRIRLENFMCHGSLQIELGEWVNFITGQNGSGKSAILTALCVAFGCRARGTQRASSLKDFIKTGCSYATVQVEIKNQGDDAFKPEIYGHTIIIERRILESTSSTTLKDQYGKVAVRPALVAFVACYFALLIDVENPCVIMSQDKSREFLHSGNDKEKFKFFFKATLLQQVHDLLQSIMVRLDDANSQVDELESSIRPIIKELDELQQKIKNMERVEEISQDVQLLKKKLAWCWVYDADKQIEEQAAKIEKLKERIPICQQRIDKQLCKVDQLKELLAEKKTQIASMMDKTSEIRRMKEELQSALSLATNGKLELEEEHSRKINLIQKLVKRVKVHERQIHDIQEQHIRDTQAEEYEVDEKLKVLQDEMDDANSRLTRYGFIVQAYELVYVMCIRLKEEDSALSEELSMTMNAVSEIATKSGESLLSVELDPRSGVVVGRDVIDSEKSPFRVRPGMSLESQIGGDQNYHRPYLPDPVMMQQTLREFGSDLVMTVGDIDLMASKVIQFFGAPKLVKNQTFDLRSEAKLEIPRVAMQIKEAFCPLPDLSDLKLSKVLPTSGNPAPPNTPGALDLPDPPDLLNNPNDSRLVTTFPPHPRYSDRSALVTFLSTLLADHTTCSKKIGPPSFSIQNVNVGPPIHQVYKRKEYGNKRSKPAVRLDESARKSGESLLSGAISGVESVSPSLFVVTAFGGERVLQLLREIEKCHRRFIRPPIGPIGAHLSLIDGDAWALPVENAIGKLLNAFIVTDHKDSLILRNCAKEVRYNNLQIIIYDFSRPRLTIPGHMLPQTKHPTTLSVVHADNPTVLNVLVDVGNAERQVLVSSYEVGKSVAFDQRIPNLKEVYTLEGYKMFSRGSVETVLPPFKKMRTGRLCQSFDDQIQSFQKEASELQELARQGRGKKRNAEDSIQQLRNKRQRFKELIVDADKVVMRTQLNMQNLKKSFAAEAVARPSYNFDELDQEIEGVQNEIKEQEVLLERLRERINKADIKANNFKLSFENLCESAKEDIDSFEEAERKLVVIEEELRSAANEKSHYEGVMQKKVLPDIEEAEKLYRELQLNREESSKKASVICPESEVEALGGCEGKTPEQLSAHLDRLKQRLQRESERYAESIDDLRALYKKKERKILRKKQTYEGFREKLMASLHFLYTEACQNALGLRQSKFHRNASLLKRQLTWQFNGHLRKKGISGHIKVSYEEKTLSVEVKMPQDGSSKTVRDTRGLSGGERSFSTLCFALALHEMTEAPFRAMDEFDVFMDAVSRKISLDTLVDFALAQGSQWIFITPHDISMVKAADRVKKQQMAAPRS